MKCGTNSEKQRWDNVKVHDSTTAEQGDSGDSGQTVQQTFEVNALNTMRLPDKTWGQWFTLVW